MGGEEFPGSLGLGMGRIMRGTCHERSRHGFDGQGWGCGKGCW